MSDLLLRLAVAVLAGAMIRMLAAFGLFPTQAVALGLAGAGFFLSARLKSTRFVVPLMAAVAYFATWLYTQNADQEAVVNPNPWELVMNGAELFIPFISPTIGAAASLWIERFKESRAQSGFDKEVTEESLLAERMPETPAHLKYDLSDLE